MKKIRLVVLISGTGRSLHNIIRHIEDGLLNAEIVHVISSTPRAMGLQYAERALIPITILEKKDYSSSESYSDMIFNVCSNANADYVVLAGFLKFLVVPPEFADRVLNMHPALTPSFSGKGFYGRHVHDAVIEYGAKITGCTVHFVNNEYDRGPVILQKAVPVLENDTSDALNSRVFAMECIAYPEALQLLAEGRISVSGRRVRIKKGA